MMKSNIEKAIKHIEMELKADPYLDSEINLRELYPELSPNEIIEIIIDLGWKKSDFTVSSWTTWLYFKHEDYEFRLCLIFDGYYFSINLSGYMPTEEEN